MSQENVDAFRRGADALLDAFRRGDDEAIAEYRDGLFWRYKDYGEARLALKAASLRE